ncbi:TIGR02594 family protein [Xenorhabdus griffiniae]|uniref:TIGR02594 family protein n=1 Tax=Xenorhabdus griffiniae TaxID=351672 RepID=UPI002358A6A7|nr:TIGR02594 family protein [Xenorhabdus griffiniae]MDC9606925.1 TIGR02594 family protein [Xenorhabdus griffiniae]
MSRRAYYDWRQRPVDTERMLLRIRIRERYNQSQGTIGSRTLSHLLTNEGKPVGRWLALRLIVENVSKEYEPTWIEEGYKNLGVHEIKGEQHHPSILQWWKDIKRGGIRDDKTPWCAAYVGAMFERVGIRSSRFEPARSYLEWGMQLKGPYYGCVAVFTRVGGALVLLLV